MAKLEETVGVMDPNGHTIYVTCTKVDSNGNHPTAVVNSLGTRLEKPSSSSYFEKK